MNTPSSKVPACKTDRAHRSDAFPKLALGILALLLIGSLNWESVYAASADPPVYIPGRTYDPTEPLVTPIGNGTRYYVDGTYGNDSNDGRSIESPFKTISKAVDRYGPLSAGDTILIRGGLYRERVSLANHSGTEENRIVIGPYNGEEVIIDASGSITGWTSVSGQIYKVKPGFVPNAVVADNEALFPEFSQDALTEGKWYYNSSTGDLFVWVPGGGSPAALDIGAVVDDEYQHGVSLNDVHYVTLYGLTVRFAGGHGINVLGNGVRVEKCRVRFNGKAGISLFGYGSTDSSGAEVVKNEVYFNMTRNWPRGRYKWGGWAMGVVSHGTPDPLFQGNVVYRNGGEGLGAYGGSGGVIRDNISCDNWSANIYVDNRPNVLVENNFVYSHTPDPNDLYNNGDPDPGDNRNLKRLRPEGIQTADENYSFNPPANLANITIANNLIVNCRRGIGHWGQASGSGLKNVRVLHNTIVTGVRIPGEATLVGIAIPQNDGNNTGSVYRNNIVYGSDPDTWLLYAEDIPSSADPFKGLTIDHNLWYHTGRSDPFHWGASWSGTYDYTHSEWLEISGTPHGGGDVIADPKLINPSTFLAADKKLQPDSPAIDAGESAGVAYDFEYAARPHGNGFGMGAFEYYTPDCDGDFDSDNDVDGSDLATMIDTGGLELFVFANNFGRIPCP